MSRLVSTSREPEEFAAATEDARRTRARVADQFRELIVEADRMGGRGEVALRVQRLVEAERRILEAKGRAEQAREMGNAVEVHREAEREGRGALRSAVMDLGVACAAWVAALDHEQQTAVRGRPAAA